MINLATESGSPFDSTQTQPSPEAAPDTAIIDEDEVRKAAEMIAACGGDELEPDQKHVLVIALTHEAIKTPGILTALRKIIGLWKAKKGEVKAVMQKPSGPVSAAS